MHMIFFNSSNTEVNKKDERKSFPHSGISFSHFSPEVTSFVVGGLFFNYSLLQDKVVYEHSFKKSRVLLIHLNKTRLLFHPSQTF